VSSLRFTQDARIELIEAHDWYEAQAPGLGARFRSAIDDTAERILSAPLQFPTVLKTVRRARLKRFPYALFYVVDGHELLVIACFHSRRDPRRWQSRA
jgi:plasmid stabilization system protein ParE